MIPLVTLSRDPIQALKVDAIGYGAKDSGEMGGGAAGAIVVAAGPEILTALKSGLARSSRRVGDVIVTKGFRLEAAGIRWVLHIVSIIKETPRGAYCPEPGRLRDGIVCALREAAKLRCRSVAFSALGTGEGRVDPRDAAKYMIQGVKLFRESAGVDLSITFSLPTHRDFDAFHSEIHAGGRYVYP